MKKAVTLALLHLAPRPGEIEHNKRMLESMALRASALEAKLIVTPELAVSGYGFRDVVGIDWIARQQATLLAWAASLARKAGAFLLLGAPEADAAGSALFNSLFLFAPDGTRRDCHHKINVLKVGAESWSTPGDRATSVAIDGVGRMGLFVCADMYSRRLVRETAAQNVDLLVSCAAWAPGEHGPNGEWEWASPATERPVLVCNRTGVDMLDFSDARSVAAIGGSIVHAHASPAEALIPVDWTPWARELRNWRVIV